MDTALEALKAQLREVTNIYRANAVLSWDRETQMPPGGASARAEQMAVLSRLAHSMFTSPEMGDLLTRAEVEGKGLPYDTVDAALLRHTRREYDRSSKLPAELVAEMTHHRVTASNVWADARQEDDYAAFAPYLQKSVDYARRVADLLGYEDAMYDALLDGYEPGMKASQVEAIFGELREVLVPFVEVVADSPNRVDDSVLHGPFDEARQEAFSKQVVTAYGYDFSRGRLDRAVHPFATSFSPTDVRITTRFNPDWLNAALFGTMHESGHGMYEQGVSLDLEGTPLARGASSTVHESQSRLWENVVGRSRSFWKHFYPALQETFPDALQGTDLDAFYRAINKVQPSFIRVEADEVTYTLHIMLRFEMEQDLLNGTVAVENANEVWNDRFERYFGVRPPSDRQGILQDVHWSWGMFGYFPTYALGTVLSVQLFEAAVQAHPEIPEQIAGGDFSMLHGWLRENLYQYGSMYEPNELVERATGRPLEAGPYLRYITSKFGEIYGIGSPSTLNAAGGRTA